MICGNSGLISLCGPEIMELPFQEALKGSPLLNLFVQEMSASLNWELVLRKPGQSFADLEKLADDIMYVCKMQMKATGYSD